MHPENPWEVPTHLGLNDGLPGLNLPKCPQNKLIFRSQNVTPETKNNSWNPKIDGLYICIYIDDYICSYMYVEMILHFPRGISRLRVSFRGCTSVKHVFLRDDDQGNYISYKHVTSPTKLTCPLKKGPFETESCLPTIILQGL